MNIEVSKEIINKFPGLNIGVLLIRQADNKGKNMEVVELMREMEDLIRNDFLEEDIEEHKQIASWKNAFSSFKSEEYHTSLERLMRIIIEGDEIKPKNKIMDLCNYISLKYLVPIGGYDLKEVARFIKLDFADGTENFVGADEEGIQKAEKGEVVYKDEVQVLSRKWSWKEGYKTMITDKTSNAVIFIDGLNPVTKEEVIRILNELKELIKIHCDAEVESFVLNKEGNFKEF